MRLVSANLEKSLAEPLNLEYRTNMMLGGLEAGFAYSNASVGAVHAMSNNALF
jgi:alcohol dehydrogenase